MMIMTLFVINEPTLAFNLTLHFIVSLIIVVVKDSNDDIQPTYDTYVSTRNNNLGKSGEDGSYEKSIGILKYNSVE